MLPLVTQELVLRVAIPFFLVITKTFNAQSISSLEDQRNEYGDQGGAPRDNRSRFIGRGQAQIHWQKKEAGATEGIMYRVLMSILL